jgi:hypothetical protein
MRLAVSQQEYDEIARYIFGIDGIFFARILNVPLVIEDNPENPLLMERIL